MIINRITFFILFLVFLAFSALSYAQVSGVEKIRSLQISNILKYLSDENSSASSVCFVGNSNIYNITKFIGVKSPRLSHLEFKEFSKPEAKLATECSIVFISNKLTSSEIKASLVYISKSPKYVVSISDVPNFISTYGGTIALYMEDETPKFALNIKKTTLVKYDISSKLIEISDETF